MENKNKAKTELPLINIRKDGTYGNEVEAFSKLCNIKTTCDIRYITNNKKNK